MESKDGESLQPFVADARTPGYVLVGFLVSFLMGILGGVVGGYAGWMWEEGLVPVAMAVVGFLLFFGITCAMSGPGMYYYSRMTDRLRAPERDRVKEMGMSSFDLYVTVHKVKDLYNAGVLGAVFSLPKYVEVMVGRVMDGNKFSVQRNPRSATCASGNGEFEECFHFVVAPTDDTIRLILRERDPHAEFFTELILGECSVNITEQVLHQGFPQRRNYSLQRHTVAREGAMSPRDPSHIAGTLLVSFTPGADCQLKVEGDGVDRRLAHTHLASTQGRLLGEAEKTSYGTWASGK